MRWKHDTSLRHLQRCLFMWPFLIDGSHCHAYLHRHGNLIAPLFDQHTGSVGLGTSTTTRYTPTLWPLSLTIFYWRCGAKAGPKAGPKSGLQDNSRQSVVWFLVSCFSFSLVGFLPRSLVVGAFVSASLLAVPFASNLFGFVVAHT